ncbi:MAG: tyrosine-type recombinase/integrase [Candidatus Bathyarchaeia archaeon]
MKKFYRWLRNATEYPEEVVWIKTGFPRSSSKLPEQLLTEDDVDKLIRTCSDAQMKALISMLWETGSRIAELLNLRIESVEPTDKYAAIIVNGKTGMRRVVIIFAWPYLMQWLLSLTR